jgi:hypothetical protein
VRLWSPVSADCPVELHMPQQAPRKPTTAQIDIVTRLGRLSDAQLDLFTERAPPVLLAAVGAAFEAVRRYGDSLKTP